MGFEQPSKIQEEVLKIIIDRSKRVNLIAQSQSGSGKTLCFVLAMLSSVDHNRASTQAICIAPTLELSEQIAQVAQGIAKHNPLLSVLFCPSEGVRNLPHTPHIIISIPKVIYALIKKKAINTNTVKLFAVDEADVLLEEGNRNLKTNVQNIRNLLDRDCQYMLFTATFEDDDITDLPHDEQVIANEDKKVKVEEFCKKLIKDSPWPCHTILAPKEELTVTTMTQCMVKCNDEKEKYELVASICHSTLADNSRQIIIFANRTDTVEQLHTILKKLVVHIGISIITASMGPQQRRTSFNRFQSGEHRVLISTNYISRGIDVANVACVINYDLPMKNSHMPATATYLHRIGRTARFGRKGCAINFSMNIGDTATVKELADHFNIKIPNVSSRELISFIEKHLQNNFTTFK
jgi:ATP-dependent RNA helicase DDX19/DBP5